MEFSQIMEMLCICAVHCGSRRQSVIIKYLK